MTDRASVEGPAYAAVAVPAPLPEPLTYKVPAAWRRLARVGVRARVPLGRRRLAGWIVDLPEAPPPNLDSDLRPLEAVIDFEPLLPQDLMDLARFAASYYATPLGEVLKNLLPGKLPAWGDRRVELTNRGALVDCRDPADLALQRRLLGGGRATLATLWTALDDPDLAVRLERWREAGHVSTSLVGSRSSRYRQAIELPPGDLEDQLSACGRSAKGRAVVEYLAALGRPATVREVTHRLGCGTSVVRRLVKLAVVRSFTQIVAIDLSHHQLQGGPRNAPFELRDDQEEAVRELVAHVESGAFRSCFLHGMTGSGKTEVYLRAAAAALEQERGVIVLVPEIALVPALSRTLKERFGDRVAVLHSNLGSAERHQEWERIRTGDAMVVVGPRSAVFAPVRNPGLLVVDEEQDGAYKQSTRPRYSGRDLALVRARDCRAAIVLVSATPSLETRLNVKRGRYRSLRLTERVGAAGLPAPMLVDLRTEPREQPRRPGDVDLSRLLVAEVQSCLDRGEQVILLRNRRGYSPQLLCRACGENMPCEDCGLPKSYHRREGRLICHYCGVRSPVPSVCSSCGEDALQPIGAGTERVEEEVLRRFPNASVDVLDRDATRRVGGAAAVLERFRSGSTEILIGTQMVSKGHHFPNVALAAVLTADSYLGFPDFRASERCYALLTQLAGRAGRGERPGRFVVQTYHPDHYAIQAVLNHDDEAFANQEMRFRRAFHYPPYTRMVQIVLRDRNRDRGRSRIEDLAAAAHRHPLATQVRFSGPAPAPLERLRGEWRFQFLMRSERGADVRRLAHSLAPLPASDITLDVDPQDLM